MGSDKSVMMRTQRGFYHDKDERPTQIQAYVQLSSLFNCFLVIVVGAILTLYLSRSLMKRLESSWLFT